MNSSFNKIFKFITVIFAFLIACAEVIFHLLSHKNGNVDFVFSGEESEKDKKIRLNRDKDYEWLVNQEKEHFYITSEDGLKLHASLLKAKVPTNRYVLAIHGYRCTGMKEFDSISRFYHEQGINVFMVDHRASGLSEGKYITYGAKESEDCLLWLSFMRKTFGNDITIALHGCSMGSATTMLLCGKILPENVVFATCDCGYATLKGQLYHNFCQFKMPPRLCYFLYRCVAMLRAGFDPESVTPVLAVENCTIPVLFVHGAVDDFVPFNMVYAVYDACKSSYKKLLVVENASHVQSFQLSDEYKVYLKEYIEKFM